MNATLFIWAGFAVSIFWCVGLYNRLMRMRARGLSALGSVEKHMRVYAELAHEQVTQRTAVGTESQTPNKGDARHEWNELRAALQRFEKALNDEGVVSLASDPLARLVGAYDAVQITWRHLGKLPPDLAGPVVPPALVLQWESVSLRVETARGGFNQILAQYNEALEQFPARLVVDAMGFKPGGTL